MPASEVPSFFPCNNEQLLGICHLPQISCETGVVIVVGGPQYRVGSHRQFVMIARQLAEAKIPVFRFDYRGMGDSSGNRIGFEHIESDIKAAIDTFFLQESKMKNVVLCGLCDAATAIMIYACNSDERVTGQVLLNPWVRTEQGIAKVYLKNYYAKLIFKKELWRKVFLGDFSLQKSLSGLFSSINNALIKTTQRPDNKGCSSKHFIERMMSGIEKFKGKTLIILSENDLTADEFRQHMATSQRWHSLLKNKNIELKNLPEANHTFSRSDWRNQVVQWCTVWIDNL